MAAANRLAHSYVQHILIAVQAGDRSAPFRTFFDNWFAFQSAGPFLNQNSRPHWFNNPCPDKHGSALKNCHFISCAAARVLAGLSTERLVKDHCVPVSVLREIIFDSGARTAEHVEQLMLRFYRVGVITKEEDDLLTTQGMRSAMPKGWSAGDNAFARYSYAGVTGQQPSVPLPEQYRPRVGTKAKHSALSTTSLSSDRHG
ncbi:MAG: hypothetical protein ACTHJK_06010 [Sphingomicrobium sp.]